jgi:serine/threonine protein kinase
LKPENIMMTSENDDADIKVVDFGFATPVNGANLDKLCGTPGYMVIFFHFCYLPITYIALGT